MACTWTSLILGSSYLSQQPISSLLKKLSLPQSSLLVPICFYLPRTPYDQSNSRIHVARQALFSEWMQHAQCLRVSRYFLVFIALFWMCSSLFLSLPPCGIQNQTEHPGYCLKIPSSGPTTTLTAVLGFCHTAMSYYRSQEHQPSSILSLNHHQDL